ncbi:MAG: terminase family protein [Hyphomonadaceae bacterium]
MGGRGAGKTRAGAEWVRAQIAQGARSIALIAPTMHDARSVMIEGPAGLLSGEGERPNFLPSQRKLYWANGAVAEYFSAEDPASLRGPQFDAAWGDEVAYWRAPEDVLATLAHALRLGSDPRLMLTTTPRPIKAMKDLLTQDGVIVTRASTFDNADNLAPRFIEAMRAQFSGTLRDRQELYGELIEDPVGALWSRKQLDALRIRTAPESLERVVVAVDPPVSVGEGADACGIVGAGRYRCEGELRAIVLADASVQGLAPGQWAARAAELARQLKADAIIAEANNGSMPRTKIAPPKSARRSRTAPTPSPGCSAPRTCARGGRTSTTIAPAAPRA